MTPLFPPRSVMKQSLKTLFKQYSKVLDVVAHKNIRMRGQAFVTLDSKDAAVKAVKEVQAFPLYGRPMVRVALHSRSSEMERTLTGLTSLGHSN